LTSLFPETCSSGAPLTAWLVALTWVAAAAAPHAVSKPAQSNPTALVADVARGVKPFIKSAFLLPGRHSRVLAPGLAG
jgi:hypothetical protein